MEPVISLDSSDGRVMVLASGILEVPMIRVEGHWSVGTFSAYDLKDNFNRVGGKAATASYDKILSTYSGTTLISALLLSIIIAVSLFSKYGWHPIAILVVSILVLCTLLFYSLSVEINKGIIKCQFGIGLIKIVFDLAKIIDVQAIVNKWYYGWGIRLTPHGWLFNVSGLLAVEITLRSGKKYRIGTDEPDRLATAIWDNLRNET